jgi:hypothetical protein
MAGSLIKIDEEIVTSAVASVTLTGIDSTYDVYMLKMDNVAPVNDNVHLNMRSTVGGSADTSAEYDWAGKVLRANTTFGNQYGTNQTSMRISDETIGTGTQEILNGIMYIFNANNSSEYTFYTNENSVRTASGNLSGTQGGFVHTEAQATDGVNLFMGSGNIASGTFVLYGLKK